MKKISVILTGLALMCASCHKCYTCKQYCALCLPNNSNGVTYKICANKDVSYSRVDSLLNAFESNGYNCNLLKNDKSVCDRPDKINDAVDYYLYEDYYCYPQ